MRTGRPPLTMSFTSESAPWPRAAAWPLRAMCEPLGRGTSRGRPMARTGVTTPSAELRRHMVTSGRALAKYETACQALAEARTVDEVKDIHDKAVAMAAYARLAKNRELEAAAIEIRMRATRRFDQRRQAQKETVGLSAGARGSRVRGARVDDKPTLASQGLDKNLAHQARLLGAMDEAAFERKVAEARHGVFRRAVREAESLQSFEVAYETRERKAAGGPGFKRRPG
jgi:hypothetical protein